MTDVRGNATSYEYDAVGRLSKIIDQDGHTVVANTYNADGRVIEQTDGLGKISTFAWDSTTQTSTMTDARGKQWKDIYSGNVLLKRIDPLGNEVIYERDAELNLIGMTDARGNRTGMAYDSRGNLLTRQAPAPLSHVEEFTYDAQNNVTSYKDGRAKTTTFAYDAAGNLTRIIQPGNVVTDFGRHASGNGLVTSVTDPRNKPTTFDYGSSGNLIRVMSPLGNATTMGYDSSGRMTSMVEPRGNEAGATPDDFKTLFSYDAANHLLSQIDPLGNTSQWTYNKDGTLASRKDAKNRTTAYDYDANHRLKTVTAPDNSVTSYSYDDAGNLTARTDANNHTTTYAYDAANRLSSVTSPTSQVWSYLYDGNGNLNQMTDAIGNATATVGDGVTDFGYDALNRLTAINYSDATPDVSYAYDADSNRTQMTDAFGTESYGYDDLNRLTSVTRGAQSFSYAYDAGSNLTRRTYPDATIVSYDYDSDSRLSSVTSGTATTSYAYDAAGNLKKTTLPASNGFTEDRSYDRAGRLTEVKNSNALITLSQASYVLDEVGKPTSMTTLEGTTTYGYDALDRITEVCFPLGGCNGTVADSWIRYTYDAVGNRLSELRPGQTPVYEYNASDQLVSSTTGGVVTSYSHDQNGNMTVAGVKSFTYDMANRMNSSMVGTTAVNYSFDGHGKRIQASKGPTPAEVTKYQWDVNAPLPLLVRESDGADGPLRRYLYGNDLISMTSAEAESYYHYDGIGSVTDVTSSLGIPQRSYSYEPFGSTRTSLQLDPTAPENLMRFTGALFDKESDLYHLRARQYNPTIGRFSSQDPLSAPITDVFTSAYAYVSNRPTAFVDPSGLRLETAHGSGSPRPGPSRHHPRGLGEEILINKPAHSISCSTTYDFLSQLACVPAGFLGWTGFIWTPAGTRVVEVEGGCSYIESLHLDATVFWDFRNACLTHDYAYELIRRGILPQTREATLAVDRFFYDDLLVSCRSQTVGLQQTCENAAFYVYSAVTVRTGMQGPPE